MPFKHRTSVGRWRQFENLIEALKAPDDAPLSPAAGNVTPQLATKYLRTCYG
jgi:hypothetical protein